MLEGFILRAFWGGSESERVDVMAGPGKVRLGGKVVVTAFISGSWVEVGI